MPDTLDPSIYQPLVRAAIAEDVGSGDITTAAVASPRDRAEAVIMAKGSCVVAGVDIARDVFAVVDPTIEFFTIKGDGEECRRGDHIARLAGPAAGVLTAERTALNFLQYLSGIANRTREFVEAAGGRITVLDTRKTAPTLRALVKYAVRCGGGINHRVGLYDAILIKDNHVRIAGSMAEAVRRVRAAAQSLPIEVEAQNNDEVDAALAAGADIIMLDNLDDVAVRDAIGRIARRARVELSGGLSVDRVRALATSGADYVSIGAITHSAPAADLSLEIEHLLS